MEDVYPKGEYVTNAGLVSVILEALVVDITSDLKITGFFLTIMIWSVTEVRKCIVYLLKSILHFE